MMNKLLLLLLACTILVAAPTTYGQQQDSNYYNNWQLSLFGGPSFPIGDYGGDIGRAKIGLNTGISLDRFLYKGRLGIRIDARFQRHNMNPYDTDSTTSPYVFSFSNGFSTFFQDNHPYFQHITLSAGPIYRIENNKMAAHIFATVGAIFQEYPEFRQEIMARNPYTMLYEKVITPFYSYNSPNNPTALATILGASYIYKFTPTFGVGVQLDYLRAWGEKGTFKTAEHIKVRDYQLVEFKPNGQNDLKYDNNIFEYYENALTIQKAAIQDVNAALVLQFTFGNTYPKKEKGLSGAPSASVIVKDKITGATLSDATVQLLSPDGDKIEGTTNKDGLFTTQIKEKGYVVSGRLNNINTTNATIDAQEFKKGNITKTLYYDDDRFILKGRTIDCETGKPIANVLTQLTDINSKKTEYATSDENGVFYYRLNHNSDFHIVANQEGKFSQTELITTKMLDRKKTVYVTLELGVCEIKEGSEFIIKNIFYDFDKSDIRPDAALVLNNIVNIMKANKNMVIQLSSHTDSRGDNTYNQRLSQRRAESAVNYLVANGIQSTRLVAKGYGESKLSNHCSDGVTCSEDLHEQNRRTEIKVLKK